MFNQLFWVCKANSNIRPSMLLINIIHIIDNQQNQMDLEGLVINKKLKGKQNKKKWNKNIDVSGLMEKIQQDQNQQMRKKFTKDLIVEDTNNQVKQDLDPNRFKNRPKAKPKIKYDNSYKRVNLLGQGLGDAWVGQASAPPRKKQQLIVPAIIKPPSGHSYNPRQEDIEKIINQVIDYEKQRPRKMKKIKKAKQVKVVPRTRNKKLRQQYLQARQRKMEKMNLHQMNSLKKIKKQIEQKEQQIKQKIEAKQQQKSMRMEQSKTGKVRQGPKIGKIRYSYKQYIPDQEQVGKKISHVGQTDTLMKQRYDSIFRRGILEPRNVKVHANKTKGKKVTQRFQED